jgi:outer membrane protein OmpA-like peptidoglycan-associated protein
MRILITGLIVFVIWSFFAMWLYVDILKPLTKKQPALQPVPESQIREADSLKQFYASMPKDLTIYFEFDNLKFKTDPNTDARISEFKSWLEKYPESILMVTGHTDFIGTNDYNMTLGLERANIIQKYLMEKGINANKIIASSKGEEQPVADHITKEGRAKNRRTEITIKK